MKKLAALLSASVLLCLVACSDDDDGALRLADKSQKEQKLLADQTSAKVSFTAEDVWTASVKTVGVTRATAPSQGGSSTLSWITLDKYKGEAGSVTINITLDVNYSGALRTGTITIVCGDDSIVITILQDAKDEEGNVPEVDNGLVDNKLELKASDISGIPSSVNIANIQLLVWDWNAYNLGVVATAKWNPGFTLTFPESLASKYLDLVTETIAEEEEDNEDNTIRFSNKNVRISDTDARLFAVDANGNYLGDLYVGNSNLTARSTYVYADGDCKITGKIDWKKDDIDIYNLDLKKGWNLVYITRPSANSDHYTYTSSKPSGTGWMFAESDDEEDPSPLPPPVAGRK